MKKVQLTFFGMEKITDKYVGRKGAFHELLEAAEILIINQISPRWQAFITEENIIEIVELQNLTKTLKLEERCHSFQGAFSSWNHSLSNQQQHAVLYRYPAISSHKFIAHSQRVFLYQHRILKGIFQSALIYPQCPVTHTKYRQIT